jgi:ADP-ribosylglycohydrolase
MLGAIAGDVIGSIREVSGTKTKDFPLFTKYNRLTDDSVLTCAVAEKLLRGGDYVDLFHEYVREYPTAGYGGTFLRWAEEGRRKPYNSWGNGAAMRVSPVGTILDTLEEVRAEAERSDRRHAQPPRGREGRTGDGGRGVPRPHRAHQVRDPLTHRGGIRLQPE